MILCVSANAAIDKTVVVDHFRLNAIHRPSLELVLPGGKGVNVARAAKTIGLEALVTGWVGGYAGQFIEHALREEGIHTAFIHTAVESRTCLSILDTVNGTMTEIYEKGRPVGEEELAALFSRFRELLPNAALVSLSGSLPPGVPADFYARLSCMAREAGVRVVLDASGEALRLGLEEGRPDVVKCNRAELSEVLGRPLESLNDLRREVRDLSTQLGLPVVITLGGSGAVAADGGRFWLAQAPVIQAVSAVGSGDAFLAGLAAGLLRGQPFGDCLRLAIACGSANALQLGAGRLRLEDVNALLEQVRVAEEKAP